MAEIAPIDLKRGKSVNIPLAFAPHSAKPVANGAASAGDDTVTIDALDSYMSAGTTVVFSSGATFILSVEATKGTTTLTSDGDNANDLSGNVADDETGVISLRKNEMKMCNELYKFYSQTYIKDILRKRQ